MATRSGKWRQVTAGAAVVLQATACGGNATDPAPLELGREACGSCRMTVTQPAFAAQLLVPGELPLFFDDLGCLRTFLESNDPPADPAAIFVTDHRTGAWLAADAAVVTRVPTIATPMGSHLVAHASPEGRAADPAAADGAAVPTSEVVPARWRTGSGR